MNIQKQLLSDYWKIQVIQSGGKNAAILWHDCNYERALKDAVYAAYVTAGQRYTTTNRLIVHAKIFDRFLSEFHSLSKKCLIGYGLDSGENTPFMGPLISEAAIEDYVRYQGIAVREGCDEVMRGKPLERTRKGFYVSPSIHVVDKADPKSVYQGTEFFGPNVAIYKVSDIDEATEISQQTQYGLTVSVYTAARENYLRVVEDSKTGIVQWNCPTTSMSFKMPVGGLKKSGNSHPMGLFAGYQCTYPVSAVETPVDAVADYWPPTLPSL